MPSHPKRQAVTTPTPAQAHGASRFPAEGGQHGANPCLYGGRQASVEGQKRYEVFVEAGMAAGHVFEGEAHAGREPLQQSAADPGNTVASCLHYWRASDDSAIKPQMNTDF